MADADGREKNEMAESSEPNLAAERVVWTSRKLKAPFENTSYFGQ